jgi:hypothetical protein
MLSGARELHLHTDHKKLTSSCPTLQQIIRYQLYIGEYNPVLHCVTGKTTLLSDFMSRVPCLVPPLEGQDDGSALSRFVDGHSIELDSPQLLNCFLDHPAD